MQPAPDPDHPRLEVDTIGLACPVPVIELARAVDTLEVGEVVALLATDPAARIDVPVWCRMQRHQLVHATDEDGIWRFHVKRAH